MYHRYSPASLAAYVAFFWFYEGEKPAHTMERRLPDGSVSLVINLHEDRTRLYNRERPERFCEYSGSVLSGAHSTFLLLDTGCLASVMGVVFRPGGAFPFLSFPLHEIANTVISLDTLWDEDLRELLLDAETYQQRFERLEHFLLARLKETKPVHPAVPCAVRKMQKEYGALPIAGLVEDLGMSQTRFVQIFKEAIGITPKQFCRIVRFQKTLHQLAKGQSAPLSRLALECGYFDQAHFIHDFRNFAALSPSDYLTRRGEYRNHVALPV
ncbi:AraC family transcriptional regulator [Thermosporothrix hazakensis]|nr:AraC family transcriptional regulator [Thermosporothrix hazakensis]